METHILLFYKFVELDDLEELAEKHREFCNNLGIRGKVLLAQEGINGSVSGTKEQVEDYKKELRKDSRFSDMVFKEEIGEAHPFNRMVVKIRDEIIRLDKKVDLDKRGKYVTPDEFLKMYENNEEIVIIDARNDYESKVGKFKGAITPEIKTFREFPEFVKSIEKYKDKKVVTYCTGGIRCEKASAYLVEQGFKDVSQLEGGIITFCQKHPDTAWEGSCFVFDKRMISHVNQKIKPISKCEGCNSSCDFYRNCNNKECNLLMICCKDCSIKNKGFCDECVKTQP